MSDADEAKVIVWNGDVTTTCESDETRPILKISIENDALKSWICLSDVMSLILTIVTENDAVTSFLRKVDCETSASMLIDDDCGSSLMLFAWNMGTRKCCWFVSCSHSGEESCRVV